MSQTLIIGARWCKVVSCTASPSTPFSQQDSITTGTSSTKTNTESFSASLGVKADFGSIGASLSRTTSTSITFSEEEEITQTFNVEPKDGQATVIWWQLERKYIIRGISQTIIKSSKNKDHAGPVKAFTTELVKRDKTFVATQYPVQSEMDTKGFEKFTE